MVSLLLALLTSSVIAYLVLRSIDRNAPIDRIVGESLILAPSLPALTLLGLSALSIPWSRGITAAALALLLAGAWLVARQSSTSGAGRLEPTTSSQAGDGLVSSLLVLLVALLLAGYAKYAYVTAGAENDFIGIWGAKGRAFFETGGINWDFLTSPWRGYAHPDYPILVPLVFAAVSVVAGQWSESLLGLVYPVLSFGGLVLVVSELRSVANRLSVVWLGTLGMIPFLFSPWIGLADGPLALLTLAALLRLARWLVHANHRDLIVGAIFLGLAMSVKNEGVALGVVAIVALVVLTSRSRRPDLVWLWPAVVLGAPWLALRRFHGLSTDLFAAGYAGRLVERISDVGYLGAMAQYLARYPPGQWLVLATLFIVILIWRRELSVGARFVLTVIGIQLLIYLAAYLVTPLPLEWHVRWSWERLVSHVGASFALVSIAILVRQIEAAPASMGGDLATLLRSSPEVEGEQADSDADR